MQVGTESVGQEGRAGPPALSADGFQWGGGAALGGSESSQSQGGAGTRSQISAVEQPWREGPHHRRATSRGQTGTEYVRTLGE